MHCPIHICSQLLGVYLWQWTKMRKIVASAFMSNSWFRIRSLSHHDDSIQWDYFWNHSLLSTQTLAYPQSMTESYTYESQRTWVFCVISCKWPRGAQPDIYQGQTSQATLILVQKSSAKMSIIQFRTDESQFAQPSSTIAKEGMHGPIYLDFILLAMTYFSSAMSLMQQLAPCSLEANYINSSRVHMHICILHQVSSSVSSRQSISCADDHPTTSGFNWRRPSKGALCDGCCFD